MPGRNFWVAGCIVVFLNGVLSFIPIIHWGCAACGQYVATIDKTLGPTVVTNITAALGLVSMVVAASWLVRSVTAKS